MATVTRENIGLLNDRLTVAITASDYLNNFEQSLKKYAKSANISGFRKGMVPVGLIKKMYGQNLFADELVRSVEKQLNEYITEEKLNIFAQPLPVENTKKKIINMHDSREYEFIFEIGLKPEFEIDLSKFNGVRYKVTVSDEMINEEVNRLQAQHGKMTDLETINNENCVLNVKFAESDKDGNEVEGGSGVQDISLLVKYFQPEFRKNLLDKKKDEFVVLQLKEAFEGNELKTVLKNLELNEEDKTSAEKYFKLTITKIGFPEKADLNEDFFKTVYPNKQINTEEDLRAALKEEMEAYYVVQSRNQLHDQIYHYLIDNTKFDFPVSFLKRWLQVGGEKPKTEEEVESEYPHFESQLKWSLITSKLVTDNKIEVLPNDIHSLAKAQLLLYMGGQLGASALDSNQQWVEDYANRMMKDEKFVEDSYHRISSEKMFAAVEAQVTAPEEPIDAESFADKLHHHHH
jgi:trigger factor